MYFYNPYFYPNSSNLHNGLFTGIKKGINWNNILNNTQRTLNIINQTIPIFKQISPIVNNTKTMFKVMNEFKKEDAPNTVSSNNKNNISNKQGPTFFM